MLCVLYCQQVEQKLVQITELVQEYDKVLRNLRDDKDIRYWQGLVSDLQNLEAFYRSQQGVPLYKLQLLESIMPYLCSLTTRRSAFLGKHIGTRWGCELRHVIGPIE